DGDDPPGRERAAVADAVDLVEHRDLGVAGPEEVGVQRVDVALGVDRAGRGDERLAGHLAAVDALAVLVRRDAAEDVDLDRLRSDSDAPPGGERAAVADAVDLVEHRALGVAGPEEVGVQRVDVALGVDRAGRGDERLAGHLAAEDALAVLVRRDAAEDVDLDRLEVEQLHQIVDCILGHGRTLPSGAVNDDVTDGAFPDGFLWGTATAAHQIEGGNWN